MELAKMADLVYTPLADIKEFPANVDAALVEGAVANEDNYHFIHLVRNRSRVLVSFGDCAVTANVTALRNPLGSALPILERGYVELADVNPQIPCEQGIMPRRLERVRPVHQVVPVDYYMPGCPLQAERIRSVLECVVQGKPPHLEGCEIKFGERGEALMSQRILIDPVTHIEGHVKNTVQLDDAGQVSDAHFHVTEFRGFERMFEGRPLWEMPGITARICGICPVGHLMVSAKAGDQILSARIPPAAQKLRRLMNLAQIIQSHALSFFHLTAPDLLLGMDSDPAGATSSA